MILVLNFIGGVGGLDGAAIGGVGGVVIVYMTSGIIEGVVML